MALTAMQFLNDQYGRQENPREIYALDVSQGLFDAYEQELQPNERFDPAIRLNLANGRAALMWRGLGIVPSTGVREWIINRYRRMDGGIRLPPVVRPVERAPINWERLNREMDARPGVARPPRGAPEAYEEPVFDVQFD